MGRTLLLLDSDPAAAALVRAIFEQEGASSETLLHPDALLDRLEGGDACDVILLDLSATGRSGLETLKDLRLRGHHQPVIVLTGPEDRDAIGPALKAGATDFLIKPLEPERVMVSIRHALSLAALREELARSRNRAEERTTFADLVGESPAMQSVLRMGDLASRASSPVLISGERGAGKKTLARAIHGSSDRSGRPFVVVNCSALNPARAESPAAGSGNGSLAGPAEGLAERIREARGGSLLLSDIDHLPADLQTTLLRALQDDGSDIAGARTSVREDTRFISTTRTDLAGKVQDGRFREDLFYRLNVLPVRTPALRERREDIPPLLERFIRRFCLDESVQVPRVTPEALNLLTRQLWPGNVRQLEHAVHRAVIISDGEALHPGHFPTLAGPSSKPGARPGRRSREPEQTSDSGMRAGPEAAAIRALDAEGHIRPLEAIEAELIQLAIGLCNGRMSEVSRRLGVGRSTLYRKIRDTGL